MSLIPSSKYGKWTLGLTIAQAVVVIALEAYCASSFLPYVDSFEGTPLKGIPVYLMIFLFSQIFQTFLCWDALLHQNTIQIIGFILLNYCTFAYSIFQNIQLSTARDGAATYPQLSTVTIAWSIMTPCLIVVAAVLGTMSLLFTWIGFKLYLEFGWKIYKKIGADPKMKKMYRAYQVFLLMLKLDFFFFLGFTVQFLVLVLDTSDAEFGLTIAAIPVVLIVLIMAVFAVRKESRSTMLAFIFGCLLAMAYFIFKLVRMYQPDREAKYRDTRRFLTFFAALSLLAVFFTLINSVVCLLNFDKGLKQHIQQSGSSNNQTNRKPQDGDVKLSEL